MRLHVKKNYFTKLCSCTSWLWIISTSCLAFRLEDEMSFSPFTTFMLTLALPGQDKTELTAFLSAPRACKGNPYYYSSESFLALAFKYFQKMPIKKIKIKQINNQFA